MVGIETFQGPSSLDLQPLWLQDRGPAGPAVALDDPWGQHHRPDWAARGLIVWPRGGGWRVLRLALELPAAWLPLAGVARVRLALRWWADAVELLADGHTVHRGDLFDSACRWPLPEAAWRGQAVQLQLRLRSPLHDDGALVHSRLELEPLDPADPHGLLEPTQRQLLALRGDGSPPAGAGRVQLLGHAHLDLAWLWPVADTWVAAERTFASALDLMEHHPELRFGHSTPALYAWLEQFRPQLFARIRAAMRAGRWEPLNGPWVETDCVLVGTASLLRQFQTGQAYSHRAFPEWSHPLAWLPDSFGFSLGLPAVAQATGVRWFCTHKLAWNASNPFPHRLFRWRSRCGAEVLVLMTAPIGTDGDPLAIETHHLAWQRSSGASESLWLPGVGDHGGGPTAEMLEQLALWAQRPGVAPRRFGLLRDHLARLEPEAPSLPLWRDELFLELHRGCATSRPDQKRHNRTLERLLREAELAQVLAGVDGERPDWRPLLFHQFHDILPGTAVPEVFDQADPQWRQARRRACQRRDRALATWLERAAAPQGPGRLWWLVQLQPHGALPRTLRLPAGRWLAATATGAWQLLASQPAPGGGQWVQPPAIAGVAALALRQLSDAEEPPPAATTRGLEPAPIAAAVELRPRPDMGEALWQVGNGLVEAWIGPAGVERLGLPGQPSLLTGPLAWCRWRDQGEFWDAWDISAEYRHHPLDWVWHEGPEWLERGPLCARFVCRSRIGASRLRLDGRLLAGSPWLELVLQVDWRQRHELLRLELPLAQPSPRWAADTPAGVIERPSDPLTSREQARWEVPVTSWVAAEPAPGACAGLALLLDGPQGAAAMPGQLGVSLLRAPTWPDPGADNGGQRLRLGLLPCAGGWRAAGVPAMATRFREPCWYRPSSDCTMASSGAGLEGLDPLATDLQLVGLRPLDGAPGRSVITVFNAGPCRRRLDLGERWQLEEPLDGLDQPLPMPAGDKGDLAPWQLANWRISRR
ncbi:MAG: glycoside hydrolase family 38 C-terminal domain-containing protein [Cyanobacteriota bacterium]|nr:glycoside hydrolase family 38 C-terminal domain-containing protein [Cyanobacteriota bacterium]